MKQQDNIETPLSYQQHHLRHFLLERSALNIAKIESICDMPRRTIHHFLKERRNLPEKHFENVENELLKYGYTPLNQE